MNERETAWRTLLRVVEASGGPPFVRPDTTTIADLGDGVRIRFLRSDVADAEGVWSAFRDGGEPHAAPRTPDWSDFGAFVSSLGALFEESGEHSFVEREGARWLAGDAVQRVEARLGKAGAERSFELFGVVTADGVRSMARRATDGALRNDADFRLHRARGGIRLLSGRARMARRVGAGRRSSRLDGLLRESVAQRRRAPACVATIVSGPRS